MTDMNALIRQGAGRGRVPNSRGELDAAMEEVERARQANDVIRLEHAEHALDTIVDRARAAAKPARPDFGAGVRGGQPAQDAPSMTDRIRADRYGVDPSQLPRR